MIYAATGVDGIFSSADGGDSWEALGLSKDFLWSLTAVDGRLFASSPATEGVERNGSSWNEVFTEDKAYASTSSSGGPAWQAVAGETGLYITSDDGWLKFMTGDKLADVLIIDETRMLTASWSNGVSVMKKDGTVQERLLEGQAAIHLQLTDDQLYAGSWGKGLHILPLADILPSID